MGRAILAAASVIVLGLASPATQAADMPEQGTTPSAGTSRTLGQGGSGTGMQGQWNRRGDRDDSRRGDRDNFRRDRDRGGYGSSMPDRDDRNRWRDRDHDRDRDHNRVLRPNTFCSGGHCGAY